MATKFILILLGLAYLISPVDIIPDQLLPYLGWIDDGMVIYALFHLIRHGSLPGLRFLSRFGAKPRVRPNPGNSGSANANARTKGKTGPTDNGKTKGNGSTPGRKTGSPPQSPYEVLGISRTATWDEIHTAYKEGIKKYHPDKVSHLGEEFAGLANEKFIAIQDAYNTLKSKKDPRTP